MSRKRVKAGSSQSEAKKKRALFVEAYCTNGGNGKQAAITAGYSPKTAESAASRLLRHVKVKAAVEKRRATALAAAEAQTDIKAADVLENAGRTVCFDLRKLYPDMDQEAAATLELAGGKLKLDRAAAREQLMKHFGLYELDNKQKPAPTVNVGVLTVQPQALNFDQVKARALTLKRAA